MNGTKHTPEHDAWDAGGHCNALVTDAGGYGEVCGYVKPLSEDSLARAATPNLFGIIGYSAEVSEPNSRVVRGYIIDRWGKRAQAKFEEWLLEREKEQNDELARLRAAVANWETWADNLSPRCCCGNCEDL